jgi:hypothetical protein
MRRIRAAFLFDDHAARRDKGGFSMLVDRLRCGSITAAAMRSLHRLSCAPSVGLLLSCLQKLELQASLPLQGQLQGQ